MDSFSTLKNEIQSALAEQGSPEWQMLRLGRFTSSEIHKLMTDPTAAAKKLGENLSVGAKTYVLQKAAERITGEPSGDVYSRAIEWGKENEPFARQLLESSLGVKYEVPGFIPYGDYAGGSLDGLCADGICEIKCPANPENHLRNLMLKDSSDLFNLHPDYWWQIQSNLLFSEMDLGLFASFDPRYNDDLRLKIIEVKSDTEAQTALKIKLDLAITELKRIIDLITI